LNGSEHLIFDLGLFPGYLLLDSYS